MYKTREMNQVFVKAAKERLYLDRKLEGKVRASNGHWMLVLDERSIDAQFRGYFGEVNGEGGNWNSGVFNDVPSLDLGCVWKPSDATIELNITKTINAQFQSRVGEPARLLQGEGIELHIREDYLLMAHRIFGDNLVIKASAADRNVYLWIKDECVATIMPIRIND